MPHLQQYVPFREKREIKTLFAVMPAFGKAYSDAEIAAIANYVTGRFGARAATITLWDAAAAPQSQAFLLPIILMYTGWSYWVFRGKVKTEMRHEH